MSIVIRQQTSLQNSEKRTRYVCAWCWSESETPGNCSCGAGQRKMERHGVFPVTVKPR